MKLASTSTLLLVLNLGASAASDKQLHLRGGGEENARRLTPMTDTPTVSSAPSTSPAPSTSEPTSVPTVAPEPTFNPTIEPCSADNLVPIGYYDDYDWIELPECVQEAAEMFGYDQNSWDKGKERCPDWCNEWWEDLTEEQQWAASVFGYNEELWNSEEYEPPVNAPANTAAPRASPATSASEPTSVPTANPAIEPCSVDNLVSIGYYDDYDWIELPECVQEAAEMFGYDQNSWDKGKEKCPNWCDEWWADLTEEQQWAASVFGYNEELWNSEEYKPPVNAPANTVAPRASPATSASEPTSVPTANPAIEPCSVDNLVPIGYYDDYDWIELPECVQEAAEMFGYDQNSWDKGKEKCPNWCDEWWEDLTEEQQWAASVFGYNEELWNNEE